ncbi:hypothetical protein E2C01_009204 [Portunus trituberculatus]|uniref:Uncharacterized protein n=1 Tax=Portunus trituberculatus TaxID=210409 RepID=A0A5B7D3X5_PORTR|nr:hypothetical protein [Portunus trituberculatus]
MTGPVGPLRLPSASLLEPNHHCGTAFLSTAPQTISFLPLQTKGRGANDPPLPHLRTLIFDASNRSLTIT